VVGLLEGVERGKELLGSSPVVPEARQQGLGLQLVDLFLQVLRVKDASRRYRLLP